MAPSSASGSARNLPPGYTSIKDLVVEEIVPAHGMVSVMGLVKDFQTPIATRRTDWKCAVTIYDKSTEDDDVGLRINIFRPENEMPNPSLGDVFVVTSGKVQSYRGEVSLLSSFTTTFHIYSAAQIPQPPQSAKLALKPPCGRKEQEKQLADKEHEYVSWLYHSSSKFSLPDPGTFQQRVEQSAHRKNKFRKLENVADRDYCDVIVNVVKEPFGDGVKTTLWVSDYTENDYFHKFSWDGGNQSHGRYGDANGMTSKWTGPYGRRSMQVTCFDDHAGIVAAEVHANQWLQLRNLRIKMASNGINLEGVLHGDRQFPDRRLVEILTTDDAEMCDPQLKETIRRKMEYNKLKKKQLASFEANQNQKGDAKGSKRKAHDDNEPKKMNAKARRKESREAKQQQVEESDRRAEEMLGLSDLVKCESDDQPVTPVSSIIKPIKYKSTVDGQEVLLTLPFTCAKYRANVRVVDFRPRKLEHFATWRKTTDADVLSNYSDSDSEPTSDGDDNEISTQYSGKSIWEWRFALLLEEADPKARVKNERFWAVVDNTEAQQLTGLDASNLRADPDALGELREKLFKLWGNLEEKKLEEQQDQVKNKQRLAANQPPPSSPPSATSKNKSGGSRDGVSNKPFKCCIRQYGVKVRESNPELATAGDGRRWVRMFGLFGTVISK